MSVERGASQVEVGSLAPLTVLIVDDDETWVRVTGRLLTENNAAIEVVTANSLREGREAFHRWDPTCVVCDYQLGDGTGLELLETVRADDADRPFLLITGKGNESVASEAIGQGVDDYIRKDQDDRNAESLAQRIRRSVRSYRSEYARETDQKSRIALLRILRSATSEQELCDRVCEVLVDEQGYRAARIVDAGSDGGVVTRATAGSTAYFDALKREEETTTEPVRYTLDNGDFVTSRISDQTDDRPADEWQSVARENGIGIALALPIRYQGVRFGALGVYASPEVRIDSRRRAALQEYAEMLGYGFTVQERKQSLVGTESRLARLEFPANTVALGRLVTNLPAGAEFHVRSMATQADGSTLYVITIQNVPQSALDDLGTVKGVQSIAEDRRIEATQVEFVVQSRTPEAIASAHGGLVKRTSIDKDTVTLHVLAPHLDAVISIRNALSREFDTATVSATRSVQKDDEKTVARDIIEALTDRQRDVLRHAFAVGYFERPRRKNMSELAEDLSLSRSTVSQHLRAAQHKVFDRLFAFDDPT